MIIDESGLCMAPTVRRTQAPRGQTPILKQKASHRDKVSVIAALSISPGRDHLSLYFQTHPKDWINKDKAAAFVHQLLRQVRGPVLVLWDRGSMHQGKPIEQLCQRYRRLRIEYLPAYAPQLNPVESLWEQLKHDDLANYAPPDVPTLTAVVTERMVHHARDPDRLNSFFRQSELPWPSLH